MFNLVLLVVFVWGILDILSGLRILFWRVPLFALGWALGKLKKPVQIGYTKDQLERMFMERNPSARRNADGQWVDENNIPFLDG